MIVNENTHRTKSDGVICHTDHERGLTKTYNTHFGEAQIAGELLLAAQENNIDDRIRFFSLYELSTLKLLFIVHV